MKFPVCPSVVVLAVVAGAPVEAQWSTATLSQGRDHLAATTVGNKALFAGGVACNSISTGSPSMGPSLVVDIYDASVGPPTDPNAWSTATLSQPRSSLAATTVGAKALFAGGDALQGRSDVVDIYDDATGTWSAATLSRARSALAATTVGTKAMFAGGGISPGDSDVVDIYDDAAGTWTTATLSRARSDLAATTVGAQAMFAGGSEAGVDSAVVDIYDDSAGTWSATVLPGGAGAGMGATTVASKAMFARSTAPFEMTVDIYDDSTGTWATITFVPGPRFVGPGSVSSATTLESLAVFVGCGVGGQQACAAYVFDPTIASMSEELLYLPLTTVTSSGPYALFAGGMDTSGSPLVCHRRIDVYDLDFGERYCSPATPNSTGIPGVTIASGTTAVWVNDFALTADLLPPGQFGCFLTSQTQGFFMPPGSQGFVCLAGNVGRFNEPGQIGQGPTFTIQVDLTSIPVYPPQAVQPGDTWNFQCWHRDFGNTNNFTDAVSMAFQ